MDIQSDSRVCADMRNLICIDPSNVESYYETCDKYLDQTIVIDSLNDMRNRYVTKEKKLALLIKSGTGSGKTVVLCKMIDVLISDCELQIRVISVTQRCSMARMHASKLNLSCYLDFFSDDYNAISNAVLTSNGFVVQLESLYKFLPSLSRIPNITWVVVIDEIEGVLSQITSTTVRDVVLTSVSLSSLLVQQASDGADCTGISFAVDLLDVMGLILLDADMAGSTLYATKTWHRTLVYNTFVKQRSIYMYSRLEAFRSGLCDEIRSGKKVAIFAATVKFAKEVAVFLDSLGWNDITKTLSMDCFAPLAKSYACITSSISNDTRKFCYENFDAVCKTVTVFITTTVITTGLSFDALPGDNLAFDSIWMECSPVVTPPQVAFQMIDRVRHLKAGDETVPFYRVYFNGDVKTSGYMKRTLDSCLTSWNSEHRELRTVLINYINHTCSSNSLPMQTSSALLSKLPVQHVEFFDVLHGRYNPYRSMMSYYDFGFYFYCFAVYGRRLEWVLALETPMETSTDNLQQLASESNTSNVQNDTLFPVRSDALFPVIVRDADIAKGSIINDAMLFFSDGITQNTIYWKIIKFGLCHSTVLDQYCSSCDIDELYCGKNAYEIAGVIKLKIDVFVNFIACIIVRDERQLFISKMDFCYSFLLNYLATCSFVQLKLANDDCPALQHYNEMKRRNDDLIAAFDNFKRVHMTRRVKLDIGILLCKIFRIIAEDTSSGCNKEADVYAFLCGTSDTLKLESSFFSTQRHALSVYLRTNLPAYKVHLQYLPKQIYKRNSDVKDSILCFSNILKCAGFCVKPVYLDLRVKQKKIKVLSCVDITTKSAYGFSCLKFSLLRYCLNNNNIEFYTRLMYDLLKNKFEINVEQLKMLI
jgi:hypothetical protein